MKRLDIEPSRDALLEAMKNDRACRNDDIKDFIRLLDKTEGPYAYMIDSAWGAGKTFFVKSVELVLRSINPQLSKVDSLPEPLSNFRAELKDVGTDFVPYYFNAWENDFAFDPLSALFASMALAFEHEEALKDRDYKDALFPLIDVALSVTPISGIGDVTKAVTGTSLVESFRGLREIRDKLDGLADAIAFEEKAKLVIFIDELDRCRPDFSVRLLEQTKNMFNNRKVIFVFSTDSQQLARAVGGMYGSGFDSARFLERFFDRKVLLTPVDGFLFAMGGDLHVGTEQYELLVHECADRSTHNQGRI